MENDSELLDMYFAKLITKVESSELSNGGKDENGFFQPTRVFVLQRLNLLKDLHRNSKNPQAKVMLKSAWQYIVEHVPVDWLVLKDEEKRALKTLLS